MNRGGVEGKRRDEGSGIIPHLDQDGGDLKWKKITECTDRSFYFRGHAYSTVL